MALFRELSKERCLSADRERLVLLLTSSQPLTPDDLPVLLLGDTQSGDEYNLKWVNPK